MIVSKTNGNRIDPLPRRLNKFCFCFSRRSFVFNSEISFECRNKSKVERNDDRQFKFLFHQDAFVHRKYRREIFFFYFLFQRRPLIFVIFYSTFGHVAKLAKRIVSSIEQTGCDCRLFQVAENLTDEVLRKMKAPARNNEIPVIRPEQLPEADGILFGMPTRFGSLPGQMKNFFDACGAHWVSGSLIGKPVCLKERKSRKQMNNFSRFRSAEFFSRRRRSAAVKKARRFRVFRFSVISE